MFSHRVIADHLRSSSFLIADGVLPSNEGRGYVLRRIMRRAMRHAHLIGSKDPLMYRLVPALVAEMGTAYPELKRAEPLITETLQLEEMRFRDTLARGIKLLDEATANLSSGGKLAGETAFKLYDTYGFPLDLTQDALKARGIAVDLDGFNAAMQRQREPKRARHGQAQAKLPTKRSGSPCKEEAGATEFLGYDAEEAEGVIVGILKGGERATSATHGETVHILTNQTPFYAESGGQIGDQGAMFSRAGAIGAVIDTEKELGSLHVHVVRITQGEFKVGDTVDLKVDVERRRATRANHSATHLLHAALKRVLGAHVSQKGSLVAPDRLRFDFSHPKALTADELERIESDVNAVIRQNSDVATRLMATDEAIKAGAEALFGEKYGNEVRVLTMGEDHAHRKPYSVELCGGTHVRRLGDIGLFTILSESAVASGVRRIEALTSEGARRYLSDQAELAREAASALKTTPADLPARVAQLAEERRKLERELAEAKKALALAGPARGSDGAADEKDCRHQHFHAAGRRDRCKGVEGPGRRGESAARFRRYRAGWHRRRQGVARRRRDGRPHRAHQRHRSRAAWRGSIGRQRRRRAARHGAGRWPRCIARLRRAGADRAAARQPGNRGLAVMARPERSRKKSWRPPPPTEDNFRRRLYRVLEAGHIFNWKILLFETALISLIIANVVAVTLDSVRSVADRYAAAFYWFETISVVIFAIEYSLRLWTAVEDPRYGVKGPVWGRIRYALSPVMLIDFLSFAPSFVGIFIPSALDLRVLRLFRLLRLMKIARYSPALSTLIEVVKAERRALLGTLLLIVCIMVISAYLIYIIEGPVQPDKFGSLPSALYWSVTTLTTTGYGDITPVTALGRLVAGITMMFGLALFALPVGIVATNFVTEIHRRDFVVTWSMISHLPLFEGFSAAAISDVMNVLRSRMVREHAQLTLAGGRGPRCSSSYRVQRGPTTAITASF